MKDELVKISCVDCDVILTVPVGKEKERCDACDQLELLVTSKTGSHQQFNRYTRYGLTRHEYKLFYYLGTTNEFLTVKQIKDSIWGEKWILGDDRISVVMLIRAVRRKIKPDYDILRLKRGSGYRLEDMRDTIIGGKK